MTPRCLMLMAATLMISGCADPRGETETHPLPDSFQEDVVRDRYAALGKNARELTQEFRLQLDRVCQQHHATHHTNLKSIQVNWGVETSRWFGLISFRGTLSSDAYICTLSSDFWFWFEEDTQKWVGGFWIPDEPVYSMLEPEGKDSQPEVLEFEALPPEIQAVFGSVLQEFSTDWKIPEEWRMDASEEIQQEARECQIISEDNTVSTRSGAQE